METFQDLNLKPEILTALDKMGFTNPTPIQAKTIPHLLTEKNDLIALAQTGTGKTAAFGIPLLQMIDEKDRSIQSLVLCPTRELCIQIAKDIDKFAANTKGFKVLSVYGGANIVPQMQDLRAGVQLVVATPGRAIDLIKRNALKLDGIRYVVMDEADEMLNMGFKEDLDFILAETPQDKQTLLFSATMPRAIQQISKNYLHNPTEISAGTKNSGTANVTHEYYVVNARDRYKALKRFVDVHPKIYAIIFCRTRRETKEVAAHLMEDGYNADALHGDLSQAQRDQVMDGFRSGHIQLLVATDVAARGLDVNDLTHVINYNLPDDIEAYVHRSGRTGRAGKTGTSIVIVHTREMNRVRELERAVKQPFERKMVPTGKDICQNQLFNLIDKVETVDVNKEQIAPFLQPIYDKLDYLSREELIQHFVSVEFNRFLSYYKEDEDINVDLKARRERPERREKRDGENFGRREKRGAPMVRLHVNVGKASKLTPVNLIGLINDNTSKRGIEIGEIDILRNFSFFNIERGFENDVIRGLNKSNFKGEPLVITVAKENPHQNKSDRGSYPSRRDFGRDSGRDRDGGSRLRRRKR